MKKKPKPDEVLASASHTEDIYMHKVNKNWEYKQRKFPNSSDIHNQDVNKFSDVLIYSRAGFVLPLAICKTLNDQMDRFSTFSNPTFPLTSHIPAQFPMFTPRPLSCSVTKYERTHNCHCIQFVSFLATFAAMMVQVDQKKDAEVERESDSHNCVCKSW